VVSLKRYFWLIHLAIITAGVYIGSDLFWAIVGARLEIRSRVTSSSPATAAAATEQRPFQQYTVIQERNLFGARGRAAAPPPPARTPPAAAPATKPAANLKLVGTVVGSGDYTYAVIEDLSTKRQDLYRLGDQIRDARVVEVTRNRVVLENRGQREELFSFEKTDAGASPGEPMARQPSGRQPSMPRRQVPPPGPQQAEPPPAEPQENQEEAGDHDIERVSESMWRINRDDLVEQVDNFGQLMREARLTPHFSGGQPDGFMISNLPKDTFLVRMGLRSGDILKGINGQKFGSLEEFFQIYQQLQTESVLQLEIERSNRTETLTYEIR
jgi:general secretion pathway protein C